MGIKIGELARRTGCEVVTIRFYEKEGLLPHPGRSEGNFRLYGEPQVERLRFIRHCRSLAIGLDEIRTLLGMREQQFQDCGEVDALIDQHIEQVEIRVKELLELKQHLLSLRGKCSGSASIEACGIMHGLADGSCHSDARVDVLDS